MGMEALHLFLLSLKVTAFVFAMMVVADLLNVKTAGTMRRLLWGRRPRQYLLAALLGVSPGCFGAFLATYLYAHGFLSFGAMVAAMVATSGDESFVMFQAFPGKALLLHLLLFAVGVGAGWATDRIAPLLMIRRGKACPLAEPCEACLAPPASEHQRGKKWGLLHFLSEHIWGHIVKEHLWRVFLWTFLALLFVRLAIEEGPLGDFVRGHLGWTLVPVAALVGLIPESGPHMIFVFLYRDGLIPFSVLLTSSVVQDGHGMLPLLALCPKDAILVKAFNLVVGLVVGGASLLVGL